MAVRIPKYRRHTVRDLGFVEWQGRRVYFEGPWNSTVSRDAYLQFIREHCGLDAQPIKDSKRGMTVAGIVARFLMHAKVFYGPGPRGTYANLRYALVPFSERDGKHLAKNYGPLRLKDYRASLIAQDHARTYINDQIRRIKAAFRWAVSEEICPVEVLTALETVSELAAGRTAARETPAKQPIPWEYVAAVLPELSPTVAAMLEFQWHVGPRSDSLCNATPGQFTQEKDLLLWRPKHKTQFRGKVLVLPVGPRAQNVIRPFLDSRLPNMPLFTPPRGGDRYTSTSYRKAVQRAIIRVNRRIDKENEGKPKSRQRALYPKWSPHLLRHSRGHDVRSTYGVEAAQAVLGHDSLSSTEIYSASRLELAKQVARETG